MNLFFELGIMLGKLQHDVESLEEKIEELEKRIRFCEVRIHDTE